VNQIFAPGSRRGCRHISFTFRAGCAVGEYGQVLPYLLGARLADVEITPDTPDTRDLAARQLGRVPLRRAR
jgi:hypothetical protein